MEEMVVAGIAAESDCANVTLINLPDLPLALVQLFGPIADAGIVVDVIVQNRTESGRLNISFTVSEIELQRVKSIIAEKFSRVFPEVAVHAQGGLGKVSIVGVGMRNHPGVASQAFRVLAEADVKIVLISTCEIKVSMVIARELLKYSVEKLHDAFNLEAV